MLYFGNWQERKYVICCTIIRKATNSVTEMEVSEKDANWLRIVIQNAASNRYHFGQRHLNLLASEIAEWGPSGKNRACKHMLGLRKTFVLSSDTVAVNY